MGKRNLTRRSSCEGFAALSACVLLAMPSVLMASPPSFQTISNRVGLVLLIRFPDRPQDVVFTQADIDAFCNQPGSTNFGNKGSVYDYFLNQSNGKFRYTSIVTAYYTATNTKAYYDDDTKDNAIQGPILVNEALLYLRDQTDFDFSKCDGNGDKWIDGINLFYAGDCSSSWSQGLWPHAYGISFNPGDGMNSGWQRYQMTDMGRNINTPFSAVMSRFGVWGFRRANMRLALYLQG